jgi:hypothetical protein
MLLAAIVASFETGAQIIKVKIMRDKIKTLG